MVGDSIQFDPAATNLEIALRRDEPHSSRALADKLRVLQQDYAQLYADLFAAAEVQRRIGGPRHVRRGAYEIACEIFAARQISGDFFCTFEVARQTAFVFGKVAGNGLVAGMWVNHVVSLVRKYAEMFPHPARIATLVNEDLVQLAPGVPVTTMFVALLDPSLHRLAYCNAGSASSLLVRGGELLPLQRGGPPIGTNAAPNYDSSAISLAGGDIIVCYSRGSDESSPGTETDRLIERVVAESCSSRRQSLNAALDAAVGALHDFDGCERQHHDLGVAILRRAQI